MLKIGEEREAKKKSRVTLHNTQVICTSSVCWDDYWNINTYDGWLCRKGSRMGAHCKLIQLGWIDYNIITFTFEFTLVHQRFVRIYNSHADANRFGDFLRFSSRFNQCFFKVCRIKKNEISAFFHQTKFSVCRQRLKQKRINKHIIPKTGPSLLSDIRFANVTCFDNSSNGNFVGFRHQIIHKYKYGRKQRFLPLRKKGRHKKQHLHRIQKERLILYFTAFAWLYTCVVRCYCFLFGQ